MLNKTIFILLAICLSYMIASFILRFYPVKVIEPRTQPYKVITKSVHVGENVKYVVDACKYQNVPATVSRTFSGEISYPSVISQGRVKKGCDKTIVSVPVPLYITPGIYHLQLNVVYKINAVRDDAYTFTTEEFEVFKATDSAVLL